MLIGFIKGLYILMHTNTYNVTIAAKTSHVHTKNQNKFYWDSVLKYIEVIRLVPDGKLFRLFVWSDYMIPSCRNPGYYYYDRQ